MTSDTRAYERYRRRIEQLCTEATNQTNTLTAEWQALTGETPTHITPTVPVELLRAAAKGLTP